MKSILGDIWKWVLGASSLCSVVGLIISLSKEDNGGIVALVAFCVFLLIVLIGICVTLSRLIEKNYPDTYKRISSFYQYRSDDGKKSTFEVYRLIQSKRILLTHIDYKYKWSGTKQPVFSSNCQILGLGSHSDDPDTWDNCKIQFKSPLTYNQSTVLHIKTENDDFDGKAEPFISSKLETPISVMHYKVLLSYKPDDFKEDAIIERRRLNTDVDHGWKYVQSVPFDSKYKQYQYVLIDPEPGYYYRIRWVK